MNSETTNPVAAHSPSMPLTAFKAYPSTIWTEVAQATNSEPGSVDALGSLLERYYCPLQRHIATRFGFPPEMCDDLLHEFIQQKILLGKILKKASRERGKFRTFLLSALTNFVIGELRRRNALKRRPAEGTARFEGLDPGEEEPMAASHYDQFTVDWARTVLQQTLARMQTECRAKGAENRWRLFEARVINPALDDTSPPAYDSLIADCGFASATEAANALVTAKRQFGRLLRTVIAEYAGDASDIEAELSELKRVLGFHGRA